MKIILKQEVDNLGLAGDIVEVADGYGRNFLLPRGMAIIATPGAEKEAQALLRARKAREAATLGDAQAMKDALESRTLRVAARVDERGHLYGSVGVNEVFAVLRERGHDIPKKRIELKSVKEIGEYEVPVQVHPQVTALVTVEVVDVEGEVTLESIAAAAKAPAAPLPGEAEADAEAGTDEAASDAASEVEALAQQALEAARALEAEAEAAAAEASEAASEDAASGDEVTADAEA